MTEKHTDKSTKPMITFFIGLVLVMLVVGALLGSRSLSYGPPVGDLTRISGLSERNFGWAGETTGFVENHTQAIDYNDLLSGSVDEKIIVFGDSFSAPQVGNITWTNTLHELTGRSVGHVNIEALEGIKEYFQSKAFKQNPPEIVIIEMAERTVFRRARSLMDRANCQELTAPIPIVLNPLDQKRSLFKRRAKFHDFDELMSWGALSLRLQLFSSHKTVHLQLSRDDLFSNKLSNQLLIYHSDILRHKASELAPYTGKEAEAATVCALRDLLHVVEGETQVYVTIAPDKRSIYNTWIIPSLEPKEVDFLNALMGKLKGHYIDLYTPLSEDVIAGKKDVYFPNDTHWSGYGHTRVGQIITSALSDSNVIVNIDK